MLKAIQQSCTVHSIRLGSRAMQSGVEVVLPPMGSIWLALDGSFTQSAMKDARSASLMGLQLASWPSPNITYGLPVFTSCTCLHEWRVLNAF